MNKNLKAIKTPTMIVAWLENEPYTICMPTFTQPKSYLSYFYRNTPGEPVDVENEHIFKYHLPKEFREILK